MKRTFLAMLPVIVALTACGGSSATRDEVNFDTPNAFAFTDVNDAFDSFNDLNGSVEAETALVNMDLPTSGSARYDGIIVMSLEASDPAVGGEFAIGTIVIGADFGRNSIFGGANSFMNGSGEEVIGEVIIDEQSLVRDGNDSSNLDLNGQIEFDAGIMAISGSAETAFWGSDAAFNTGIITGTATPTSGPSIDLGDLSGWVAERQ